MFIVPTRSRFISQNESPNPKAVSHAGNSRAELRTLGERMGYQDRVLSAKDVRGLSSDEFMWFETFFPQRLSDAAQIENNKREYRETKPQIEARRMWSGQATDEESAAAQQAGSEFANRYPGFVRHTENATAIARYMQTHDLDATKVESYAEAMTALATQGSITLSPRDAGVGPEVRITGNDLKTYARLHLLLQPSRVLKPEDKLSAGEYRKLNPELFGDYRVPYLIQKRQARQQATEQFMQRSESATDRASITNLTDFKSGEKK